MRRLPRVWIAGALLVSAVCIGFGYGYWTGRSPQPVDRSAIHWNEVQAVPTRTPDAADIEWQKRGELQPSPSWGGLGGGEAVSSAADAARPPPLSSPTGGEGRNDGIYVIDGDTFSYGGQRFRIAGIDAPEIHPPRCMEEARLGLAATEKLRQLLGSGTVTISGSGHDQYGR